MNITKTEGGFDSWGPLHGWKAHEHTQETTDKQDGQAATKYADCAGLALSWKARREETVVIKHSWYTRIQNVQVILFILAPYQKHFF